MMSRLKPLADSARCALQPNGGAGMIRAHVTADDVLILTEGGMEVARCMADEQGAEALSDPTLRKVALMHIRGRRDMARGKKMYRPVELIR